MRGLELAAERAQERLAGSRVEPLVQIRAWGVRAIVLIRLFCGCVCMLFALWLGARRADPTWHPVAAILGSYSALLLLVLRALRKESRGVWLLPLTVLLDLVVCVACGLARMPYVNHPLIAASQALAVFVLDVVFAAISIESLPMLAAACGLAAAGEVVLLASAHGGPAQMVVAGAIICAAGGATSLAFRRFETLSVRLVREEAARRVAVERGGELERVNAKIASINAELEEQHQRLVLAQRDAETMTSMLVHDMKQPLASVLGMIEQLAEDVNALPGGARLVPDLHLASTQGRRLLAMVDDLLAIARLERGALIPRREETPMVRLLSAVAHRHPSRASRVEVEVRGASELTAPVDRELTERLIENLLANAFAQVRPGDRVELSVERQDDEVVVAVKNSGPPVPPELRAGLFEKLVTRGARANAGLGLYFCRLVVEAHQGRIALEEDAAFAVSFVARLPASSTVTPHVKA